MEDCKAEWCNCQHQWSVWVVVPYSILLIVFGGYTSQPCTLINKLSSFCFNLHNNFKASFIKIISFSCMHLLLFMKVMKLIQGNIVFLFQIVSIISPEPEQAFKWNDRVYHSRIYFLQKNLLVQLNN